MKALERELRDRLKKQQAVYAIVAVIGSTEEGAVDPLDEMVALRSALQEEGMSFVIHADAAWGGVRILYHHCLPPDILMSSSTLPL